MNDKQKLKVIRDFIKTDTSYQSIHKNKELTFNGLNMPAFRQLTKRKIYKSPNWGRQQSSEYYISMIDGRLVWLRKANHWGIFFVTKTNHQLDADDCRHEYYEKHDWKLIGGGAKEHYKTSQCGYIFL